MMALHRLRNNQINPSLLPQLVLLVRPSNSIREQHNPHPHHFPPLQNHKSNPSTLSSQHRHIHSPPKSSHRTNLSNDISRVHPFPKCPSNEFPPIHRDKSSSHGELRMSLHPRLLLHSQKWIYSLWRGILLGCS